MSTSTAVRLRVAALALSSLAAALTLSACGNKGPLVLPDKTPAGQTVTPSPAAAPATPAIDETASPLPPSSPPPAADPVINQTSDDGTGR